MKSYGLLILLVTCYINTFAQAKKKINVLFLGNSYTYVNNLPQLIKDIANANGDTLLYDSNCIGGYTFENHFNDVTSCAKIKAQAWNFVVLQAQSQEPSFSPGQVAAQTLPFAIKLDSLVKRANICAQSVFFETWGRKNGDASNCAAYPPICTYVGMQDRLRASYKLFADTTHTLMSPVGEAWRKSIANKPSLELYSTDESHPVIEGSYLAACVFYEVLFRKSVVANSYMAGLTATNVAFLQQVAHSVVNDSLLVWNIGKYIPCPTTGILNESLNLPISIYPNPAKKVLYTNTHLPYKIYDVLGKICASGDSSELIPIENLQNGFYFIELKKEIATQRLQFIKE
jgi:Secretion system C-terminal sorting domain